MQHASDIEIAVFERLRPRLKTLSCRIVGSEAEAEDIVQDCFLKWQDADRTALETPAAWLTTVVQRQSIDRLRKRARDESAARVAAELFPHAPSPPPEEALLWRGEIGEALARLLGYLSPAERLALVLHEVFECRHEDIAAALGTKTVNARQHLARARRRLQRTADETPADEKLCRELVRRFQAAINGMDVPAMLMLLGEAQPVSVHAHESAQLRMRGGESANDASYALALAA